MVVQDKSSETGDGVIRHDVDVIVRVYRPVCYAAFMLIFVQAEDGIRYLVRSRGLGDVYKRQTTHRIGENFISVGLWQPEKPANTVSISPHPLTDACLLYTSDAADERSSVDLGGRRIIKKQNPRYNSWTLLTQTTNKT